MGKQPKRPKRKVVGISELIRGGKTRFQVSHAGKYIGFFSSFKAAQEAKAKATEQTIKRKTNAPLKTSKFHGVVKRASGRYQAQVYDSNSQTMQYVGVADSAEDAADIVVQHAGVASRVHLKAKKHKRFNAEEMVERFKIFLDIYTDTDGSPAIMSDITSAVDDKIANPMLSVHAPALYFMSLMGKDGPWKVSLAKRWKAAFLMAKDASVVPKQSAPSLQSLQSWKSVLALRSLQLVEAEALTDDDLMAMIRILQASALDTWSVDRTDWDLNVNRRKLYFMGWQRLVKRFYPMFVDEPDSMQPLSNANVKKTMQLIRKAHHAGVKPSLRVSLLVCFRSLGNVAYVMRSPRCPCRPSCPSCRCCPCFGEGMLLEKAPIPRTLDLYINTTEHLLREFRALHPPSLSKKSDEDYVLLWLIRSHFVVELRSRGIKCVTFNKKDEANKLLNVFPDSNVWIDAVIKYTKSTTIEQLMTRLGWQNRNPRAHSHGQWLGK